MSVIQPERVSAFCGGSHDTRRKGKLLSSITVTVTFSGGLGLTRGAQRVGEEWMNQAMVSFAC